MPFTAIVGAGPLGGALAQRLAARDRTREVRLIDADGAIARGKALDIQQSSPIEAFSTRVTAADAIEAAAGADVIVLADGAREGTEHAGEAGLGLLRRLSRVETNAPFLFAGAGQRELMLRAAGELRIAGRRLIGSAPAALASAVRALAALELNGTGVDVQVLVVGVPPHRAVVAWEEATAAGQPLRGLVPPHRLAAISARLPGLWPPGPIALASAAARVAEALAAGSRRRFVAFVAVDDSPGTPAVAAMPIELEPRGVRRVLDPQLSRQERTVLETALTVS